MYSANAAYKVGRRIGRTYPNVWATQEELMAVVQREIGPQVRPRSARLARDAEQLQTFAVLLGVLSGVAVALFIGAAYVDDGAWMPTPVRQMSHGTLGLIAATLVLVTLLLTLAYLRADTRARREAGRLRFELLQAAYVGASETIAARRARVPGLEPRPSFVAQSSRTRSANGWDITPRDAEELAARWMRTLGASQVEVTQFRGDGGVDVTSTRYIAQVKHLASNVGVAPIRELAGVVRVNGRRGIFFATTGYTPGAIDFANSSGIALFHMDLVRRELVAVNAIAEAFKEHGLHG